MLQIGVPDLLPAVANPTLRDTGQGLFLSTRTRLALRAFFTSFLP